MNKLILFTFFIVINLGFSQNGKMYLKDSKIDLNKENTIVYQPANGVIIPEDTKVQFVYKDNKNYYNKSAVLIKKGNQYEFSYKFSTPTVKVIFASVLDGQESIDNNKDRGYVVYFNIENKSDVEKAKIEELALSYYANYVLKLDITPQEMIHQYEELFAKNPKLINSSAYKDYLFEKYSLDKEKFEPELLAYAQKKEKSENEEDLKVAFDAYRMMKMEEKSETIKTKSLTKYPNGIMAKDFYFANYFNNPNIDEVYIKETFGEYKSKFNDNSDEINDQMNAELIRYYVEKKDLENINKYEKLLKDKNRVSNLYNQKAWELSGQDLTSPGSNLEYAADLSNKSLTIASDNLKKSEEVDNAQGQYNTYADTYALILYKQKKYAEAFQYQEEVRKLDGLDTGGKERYAAFAEQYKGVTFTKDFIEKELLNGVSSPVLTNQLQRIYEQLNLPEDQYNQLKEKSSALANKKNEENILNEFGTIVAPNFTLTNLQGKTVQLSDYKGKIVVLDFWATWCGPCKASFPKMQEIVSNNKDVVFLFIDTFEQGKPEETLKKVSEFIENKKYSFNVLFDYKQNIAENYKVTFIPKKYVVDENGNLIAINISEDSLQALIDDRRLYYK